MTARKGTTAWYKEKELLKTYLHEKIDRVAPTSIEKRIELFKKHGYIDYGVKWKDLPNFEQWKKLKTHNKFVH